MSVWLISCQPSDDRWLDDSRYRAAMAEIHHTTLVPSKLELLRGWLPAQPWYLGSGVPDLTRAGGFRLDDPAGADTGRAQDAGRGAGHDGSRASDPE